MEMTELVPESRRAARRAVELDCELICDHWDHPVTAICTDLSPYGVWLETTTPLKPGERVVISFTPPNRNKELTLFARVTRIERDNEDLEQDSTGVGHEFQGLSLCEQHILSGAQRGLPPHLPGHKRDRRSWH